MNFSGAKKPAVTSHSFQKGRHFSSQGSPLSQYRKTLQFPHPSSSLLLSGAPCPTRALHTLGAAGNMAGDLALLAVVSLLSALQQGSSPGAAGLGLGEVSSCSAALEIILEQTGCSVTLTSCDCSDFSWKSTVCPLCSSPGGSWHGGTGYFSF